ncbi:MAG: hypothetical protein RLZZ158_111 [Cyanobacteriota bacterium]|jgi:MscS family membrane protein
MQHPKASKSWITIGPDVPATSCPRPTRRLVNTAIGLGLLALLGWGWRALAFGGGADRLVVGGLQLLAVVLLVRLANALLVRLLEISLRRLGTGAALEALTWLEPFIRTVVWLLAVLCFLQFQGLPFGALLGALAGAGVGLGFALQGPAKDIITYLTILFDKPFEIGQLLHFDDVWGEVERVGIRATQLRSISGERVIINNAGLMQKTLRNFGSLEQRRLVQRFGLAIDTPVQLLEEIPSLVRAIVENVPPTRLERCHLIGFDQGRLTVELAYRVPCADYSYALDCQQAINLALLRAFKEKGIALAPNLP